MDQYLLFPFIWATLFETLTPGPTLALVIETRASAGKREAQSTVDGITLANILWVVVAVFILYAHNTWFNQWANPFIQYLGIAFIIYLASRRILSSTVLIITGQIEEQRDKVIKDKYFYQGFWAHWTNPITVAYYFATFNLATSGKPIKITIAFGIVAILIDLLVYGFLASVKSALLDNFLKKPFIRLFAGLAFFYLAAHGFSNLPDSNPSLSVTPIGMMLMLLGFLVAAILEAYDHVVMRQGKNNKLLWRTTALWGMWFSVYALVGAFYTLINGITGSMLIANDLLDHHLRILFVVSAVIAIGLSFFKAFGELQDEKSSSANNGAISSSCWHVSPKYAALGSIVFLASIFFLLSLTSFRIK